MKSRAGIYDFLNLKFDLKDEFTCKEMNQKTLDFVLSGMNYTDRFNMYKDSGSPIKFIDDIERNIGPLFIKESSSITNTTDAYEIGALTLLSPIDFIAKAEAGMHYCKLMSPARMLEWMLVGSLHKKHYWIENTISDEISNSESVLEFL